MKKRFSEEQIIGFLREVEAGMPVKDLCRSLLHARTEIENWRREYNEERPKKALGGLTPAAYAKQLQ